MRRFCLLTPLVLIVLHATSPALATFELDQLGERRLQNANLNVTALEETADELEAWVQKYSKIEPIDVPWDEIMSFNNKVEQLVRSRDEAIDFINKLPAEEPRVQAMAQRLRTALERASAANKLKEPIAAAHVEAVNAAAAKAAADPGKFDADLKRLEGIIQNYHDPVPTFTNWPTRATELSAEFPNVLRFLTRLETEYDHLIRGGVPNGIKLQDRIAFARGRLDTFLKAAQQLEDHQAIEAAKFMDGTEKNLDVLYNGKDRSEWVHVGSVEQAMGFANERIELLATLRPSRATPLRQRYEALTTKIVAAEQANRAKVIAETRLPDDNYDAADAAALKQAMREEYLRLNPGDEILTVLLPVRDWEREQKWVWNNRDAFEKYDRSTLQGRIVVKDGEEAMLVPVNLYRYHLENDRLSVSPWRKEDIGVRQRMLIENMN
jgi:hypothetical protein